MAINGSAVFEIRNVADFSGAADTNGAGFCTAGNTGSTGTDYAYANINADGSAKYALTNGHYVSGTTILTTSASADMIGNLAYIAGGTGAMTGNWYQITNQSTGTSLTLDRSTGLVAGTGMTINIGGCLKTLGGLGLVHAAIAVAGMRAWQKYSTSSYAVSSSSSNVSGGVCSLAAFSFVLSGYDATRGDRTGNQPLSLWTAAAPGGATYMLALSASVRQQAENMVFDGGSVNNACGVNLNGARDTALQCIVQNCNGTGGIGMNGAVGGGGFIACKASACTTGFQSGSAYLCLATGCTTGFLGTPNTVKCLATSNTNGFSTSSGNCQYVQCTADSNTTAGFTTNGGQGMFYSCISSNQSGGGGIGFNIVTNAFTLNNCASYNNTTEISGTPLINENMILNASFTGGQPYTVAGSDFRPNDTAGAGGLLQGAGIGVYGQTANVDIGAMHHGAASGGATTYIFQVDS